MKDGKTLKFCFHQSHGVYKALTCIGTICKLSWEVWPS